MAGEVETLRQAGFSEDEIRAHLAPKVQALQEAGFTEAEISKNFGVKPVEHEPAQKSLGGRVWDGLVEAGKKATAGPIAAGETAMALATSFGAGFPAYLVGGVGGLIARHTYSPDTDPKVIAQMFSEAVTYNPRSDTGKRLTDVATYPFQLLTEFAERQGRAVADKTGSAPLAAITDETIKMLPFVVAGSLVRSLKGSKPDNSKFHETSLNVTPPNPPKAPVATAEPMVDVYHGSPHEFTKFDTSKIGTGEGAQTYGHGLYFAENQKVARNYQRTTSDANFIRIAMESYDEFSSPAEAAASLKANPFLGPWERRLVTALEKDDWLGFDYPHQAVREALRGERNLKNFDPSPETIAAAENAGYLYRAQIPQRVVDSMLDWDKPLSEQPATVREGLARLKIGDSEIDGFKEAARTPEGVRQLQSVGITGIRYLDQGSRAEGKGTSNYVLFDANDAMLVERNGEKIAAAQAELRDNLQETYEKTGLDPEVLAQQAKIDPTVLEDLASSNIVVPRAAGGPPPAPPTPPTPPAAPAAPPPGSPAAAQAAVLARVSTGEVPVREYTWDKFYTAAKDDLYPIAKIEKALAQGGALETAESPYRLARLVRGAAGKATQFLDHGTFDFNTYRSTGPGLKQILEPVSKDLEGIRAYMVARRAIELDQRGIQTAVPLAEAQQVVANGGQYAKVFDQAVKYQNEVTRYLKDSGLLSEEAYAAMLEANKDYVPFFRVFEEEAGKAPGKGFSTFNPIRSIKGSERLIVDPIESIIKNTYLYTALAERNATLKAFGDLVARDTAAAEALGIEKVKTKMRPIEVTDPEIAKAARDQGVSPGELEAFTIFRPNALQPAPNQIRYYDGGKAMTLKVPLEVADAFKATDKESAGILLKMVSFPARTLRAGAILSPDFIARNPLRDQYEAFINSKSGYVPVYDLVRGAMSIAKKDGDFQNWLKSGGANSALVSLDREYLQQHMKTLDADTGLMQRSWNVVTSPIEILRITSELMENATRLGEFKRAKAGTKGDIQAAGFESREVTLDFQRMGAQTRGLNMISAFFNASAEGFDRSVRAVKDNPVAVTAKVGAAITAPSILLWYANNNTPERQARWREVPNWQRDLFWIVMTDEHTYRIPKPHGYGVLFGSSAERMLDQFAADKPDAMKDFMKSVGGMTVPGVMPTGAVPLLEHMTNHSFFSNKPLIPSRMENILPEYQYQEYTTQTSRVLGQMVGQFPGLHDKSIASPIVIDNYIRGWTGGLGAYARDLLDWDLRKLDVLPDPPQPLATLADIPVVRAFVVRYPSATAQSVQDFYDKHSERKKVYDTFQYLVRNGDPEAALKEAQLDMGAFARLDGISASMREMNSIIRMVYRHPDMTPSDKRQLIDSMYGMMIEMARSGNEAMREVDKVLKPK